MITPHVSTFDTAQRRIVNLLQNDAYRLNQFDLVHFLVKCCLYGLLEIIKFKIDDYSSAG